jgi:hypothetical protein
VRPRPWRRRAFASFLGSALAALQGGAACAPHLTCPWTQVSDVTVQPATACLSVSVAPFDDNPLDDPGGCADPSLVVANDCAEPLAISDMNVSLVEDGGSLYCPDGDYGCGTVGDSPAFVIPAGSTSEVLVAGFGAATYVLPALLGSQPITISFSTR